MNSRNRILLALGLVVFGVLMRLVPHPWNLTPVGAVALFSGACFERKRWAFAIPLATLFISDALLGVFHVLSPAVYATFALTVCLGIALRSRRNSPLAVAGGAVGSATIFYLVTNGLWWMVSTTYPKTGAGLLACYVAGLPYYGTNLGGDLIYSAVLFGTFVWFERRVPAFA